VARGPDSSIFARNVSRNLVQPKRDPMRDDRGRPGPEILEDHPDNTERRAITAEKRSEPRRR
jgi:hypothetical protein